MHHRVQPVAPPQVLWGECHSKSPCNPNFGQWGVRWLNPRLSRHCCTSHKCKRPSGTIWTVAAISPIRRRHSLQLTLVLRQKWWRQALMVPFRCVVREIDAVLESRVIPRNWVTYDCYSLLFFFIYMQPQILDVQQLPGNMVEATSVVSGHILASRPNNWGPWGLVNEGVWGLHPCTLWMCGVPERLRKGGPQAHRFCPQIGTEGSANALSKLGFGSRHLWGRLWQTSHLDLWPGISLGLWASCTEGVADTGSGLLRLKDGGLGSWGLAHH